MSDWIVTTLKDISGIKFSEQTFVLAIIIVLGFFVNLWLMNIKGRQSLLAQLIDATKEIAIYTVTEFSGNIVQIINAILGVVLLFGCVGSLLVCALEYSSKSVVNSSAIVFFLSCLLLLILTLPWCAKFTRHRY